MDVYTEHAIAFIEQSVATGQPFFAYLATNTPHDPFHDVPEDLYQKYLSKDLALVSENAGRHDAIARTFAMVENIDQNVGRVLDAIDGLGIERETIVLYLHDNGPAIERYVGEMRGRKSMAYEGGIRTPLFVRWPGHYAPSTSDRIASHVDVLPTLVEIAGGRIQDGRTLDGRSLKALLEGRAKDWADRQIFIQAHRGDERVARHQFAVIGQRYKLLRASGFGREQLTDDAPPPELYDLLADPFERHDLAKARPEMVAELLGAHDRWFADVTSERDYPARILIGTDRETTTVLTRNDWTPEEGGGGSWRLTAPAAVKMGVRVLFRELEQSPEVRVAWGTARRTVAAGGSIQEVDLGEFEFAQGDLDLFVQVKSAGRSDVPAHVVLTRIN